MKIMTYNQFPCVMVYIHPISRQAYCFTCFQEEDVLYGDSKFLNICKSDYITSCKLIDDNLKIAYSNMNLNWMNESISIDHDFYIKRVR